MITLTKNKYWRLISQYVLCTNVAHKHTMSSLFRPTSVLPRSKKGVDVSDGLSKSQRLMISHGLLRSATSGGSYHLLPLAVRSLEKLIKIIDDVLTAYSCQKIQMPILTPSRFWEMTGRLVESGSEVMQLRDRHKKGLILSPTHEEAICDMLREYPWTFKNLPFRLYQITTKFRDEKRPRFGLLRSREFLMKDLYTFDVDETSAMQTYELINEAYSKIFDTVGINYLKVEGSSGIMGGNLSHEFHLISDVGEDKLISCTNCGSSYNVQVVGEASETENENSITSCIKCNSTNVQKHIGIEIGHSFLLGKKYTKTFQTRYLNADSKNVTMEMGCYGIGVTRFLAAVIEVLSTDEQIRLPVSIAPYMTALLPPKSGSKEELQGGLHLSETLCSYLNEVFPNDTLVDDRLHMTIGKRFADIRNLGIPHVFILGKSITESVPLIEVHNLTMGGISTKMTLSEVQNYVAALKINPKQGFQNESIRSSAQLDRSLG